MGYVLYGSRRSGSLAVELALAELNLDYVVNPVDLDQDKQREPRYETVNPQRKLPALVTPEGDTLTESAAILLTLDERHPGHLLPPPGSVERAHALRWLIYIAAEIYPLVEINDYPDRFAPTPETVEQTREIAREHWRARWLILEAAATGPTYFASAGFSACDIYIAVVSRWAQQDEWRPANLPRVEAITAAVSQRPALIPIWRAHRPDDAPGRFD